MNKCSVIRDLLPLYADGVCSEESHQLVTEHLKECKACRDELDMLSFDFKISSADEKEAVKKFKKKTERRVTVKAVSVILAVAVAVFGVVNAVWYVKYAKPMNMAYSLYEEYFAEQDEKNGLLKESGTLSEETEVSLIEVILGENNSLGIDTEKYKKLSVEVVNTRYLENKGVLRIDDGKSPSEEIETYIEVRVDRNGEYEFLVNLLYAPPNEPEDYWPCFSIDADMNLITYDVEEYVKDEYRRYKKYTYMQGKTEEEVKEYLRTEAENMNAEDRELYEEYYDTVKDLMTVLYEGFGIGNVKG